MREKNFDYLKVLTKDDIIEFLKINHWLKAPSKNDVNFFKWERDSDKIQKKMRKHCEDKRGTIFAKKIDALSEEFNAETDVHKRFEIFKKREVYVVKYRAYHKEYEDLLKKEKKNNAFLEKIKKEEGDDI